MCFLHGRCICHVFSYLDAGEFGVVWGPGVELFPLKCNFVNFPFLAISLSLSCHSCSPVRAPVNTTGRGRSPRVGRVLRVVVWMTWMTAMMMTLIMVMMIMMMALVMMILMMMMMMMIMVLGFNLLVGSVLKAPRTFRESSANNSF